ncbi:hypothetical protein SERLA73DRAFT_70001 [Serpula lacrymans var. lacrymans S7.3]|uniref:Uncharacterized protein n=2 Tax=Serpula lacrymans var. lacrymans TaxID=341189 RepID=F8PLL4_SERL3|nr:uncharacterized protein SERLADRAFT_434111 [Serpula lacrymans var. lacrymans S7.9]EGO02496.1 hypothetical protein SERLA73DRAFT_70001 [Serpula lacrymans var. lacrymans S7.3]EGO28240.1 hypothetical protein SERLADRAFT_434111 [Serpula lacrymans var. lacrymans S7.9]
MYAISSTSTGNGATYWYTPPITWSKSPPGPEATQQQSFATPPSNLSTSTLSMSTHTALITTSEDQVQPIIEQIVRNLKYNSQDVYVQQFYIEPSSFPEFVDKLRESDYSTLRYTYDYVKGIFQLSMPTPVHEVFIERLSELLQGELSGLIRWSDGKFKLSSNTSKFLRQEGEKVLVKKYWEELPHLVGILVVKFYESHKYAKPQYGYAEPVNMQYWYNLQKDNNIKYGPLRTADSITWAGRFVVDMYLYEKDPKVVGKEGYARDLPMPVVLRVVPNIDVGQLYPTQAQRDEFNKVFNCVITRSILEMEKIMRSAPQTVANLEAESAAAQIAALEVATQDLIANRTGHPLQTGTHPSTPTTTLPTPHLHPQVLPKEISPIDLSVFNIQLDFDNFLQAFQRSVADLAHRRFQDHYNAPRSRAQAARRRSSFYSEEEDQEDYDSDGSEDIFLNSLQEPFNNFLNDPAMQGNTQDNLNPDPEMQAGSSHHPHSLHFNLDDNDDDDERVVEQNENAGKVIRVDLDAHNKWRESFHQFHQDDDEMDVDLPDNRWAPFSTELDWKFAHWALQEGVGQKSLNRLLAIPASTL